MTEKTYYLALIRSPRPDFINTMTKEEKETMTIHFEYLKRLMTEDKLFMAGPCTDGAFGVIIFKTETEEEAKKLIENDPSVQSKIMTHEIHPFDLSLLSEKI